MFALKVKKLPRDDTTSAIFQKGRKVVERWKWMIVSQFVQSWYSSVQIDIEQIVCSSHYKCDTDRVLNPETLNTNHDFLTFLVFEYSFIFGLCPYVHPTMEPGELGIYHIFFSFGR